MARIDDHGARLMDSRAFKDQIYEQFGRLGKSLASPKRLEMLDVLCQGPRTVESLAVATSQTLANASQHLKVLRTARLVEAEKQGLHVTYRLAGTEVCDFFLAFRHLAESRLAEIERTTRLFLDGKNVLEAVDQATLLKRVRSGEALVLDVRPEQEYRNGHIPGALSVPLAELEQRLAELPRDRQVVAYCRGPYCVMAVEAVEILRRHGHKAARLEIGVPDWRALGLPLESQP
ncbi:metalloregulator ArsR/SmtB family transcription factor [Metallibacterium sp.]|uniref:ArsR/SmtB family transcription factor n=1 Tax=Metallibacterium sp. TaxID=2940281 RepID=UPI0026287E0F|nr:metalloregulator ArsR/SmtB family transcription factor [Metallibacterium sp.]